MSKKKGFTLVELLAVMFIIGILAAVVIVNISAARAKGRDAKRRADLNTIKSALEMNANANQSYAVAGTSNWGYVSYYFDPASPDADCKIFKSGKYTAISVIQGLINGGFLSTVIKDPSQKGPCDVAGGYFYMINAGDVGHSVVTGQSYCLYGRLEKPNINTSAGDVWDSASAGNLKDTVDTWGWASNSSWKMNYKIGNVCP